MKEEDGSAWRWSQSSGRGWLRSLVEAGDLAGHEIASLLPLPSSSSLDSKIAATWAGVGGHAFWMPEERGTPLGRQVALTSDCSSEGNRNVSGKAIVHNWGPLRRHCNIPALG